MTEEIPKFVLTGGPCGGKTTARGYLRAKLGNYGFTPFFVPELATEFIVNGITPETFEGDQFQIFLFRETLRREALYMKMAHTSRARKKIIFCDRGLLDICAYSGKKRFEFWLDRYSLSLIQARDERYDAVFHLVTAASGAEQFYTTENNDARSESLEEAREKDAGVLKAWSGHPHLRIIDNSTDFTGKMRRLLSEVCRALNIPAPLEIERKFLVKKPRLNDLPASTQRIALEQIYLHSENARTERRVRKREQDGACVFVETRKQRLRPSVRTETERQISELDYFRASMYERDPRYSVIRKDRFCFAFDNQYFELDSFHEPLNHKDLWLLEIELTEEQQEVNLPPFITVLKEVTNDPSFSNRELARVSL